MRAFNKSALAIFLMLALHVAAMAANPPLPGPNSLERGTLTGQVFDAAGQPLSGGMVQLFNQASGPPPSQQMYWRVPDIRRSIDNEGRFTLQLPEGNYYLGAIKRNSSKAVGPPLEGDLFYISTDALGGPKLYSVKAGAPLDLGKLTGAVPFKSSMVNYGEGITAIEGTIVDSEGKAVDKAHVLAFRSAAAIGRPLFVAEPTGKDGKFVLRVADGGSYFLKVRSTYGGSAPVAGEMVGSFGEGSPVPVTLKKGERLQNIQIAVIRFGGRGRAAQQQTMQQLQSRQLKQTEQSQQQQIQAK